MENAKKLIVGVFVGGCLLLFGVGLFLIGNSNQMFTKAFEVHAEFSKITGVQKGGKVRVNGMDAGTVQRIDVPSRPDGKFRVHLRVIEKLHPMVRQDSVATIQTDGLLGNKFLQIGAGTFESPMAQDKGMILAKEPFDWGDLMDQISDVVKQANGIMAGVKDQLVSTLDQIEGVAKSANHILKESTPHVKRIMASADKIGDNLKEIVEGVQAGEGTVGQLFKDKELYASIKRSANSTEKTVENIRDTSESAKKIAKKVEDSEIVPEVQKTIRHMQEITARVKDAVEKFESASGEGGVAENLQRTLANANEAMADLSDDTEALKRNFFFRGFFKRRGFYDLDGMTEPDYRDPSFGKGFKKHRIYLESAELFSKDGKGVETLSPAGKARLDAALTEILKYPRNGPLMLEGFASAGPPSQQYLTGRRRAALAQSYVIARFQLRPAYTGIISLGAEPDENGRVRDGIGIVSFYK